MRRRRRATHAGLLLLGLLAAGAIVMAPAPAEASTPVPVLALDWSAPAECPDGAHVKDRVEQLIGRSVGDRTLTATGRMSRSGSTTGARYRLELLVGDELSGPAERRMAGADCARMAEAAALILALDIDPDAFAHVHAEPPSKPAEIVSDAPSSAPRQPVAPAGAAANEQKAPRPTRPSQIAIDVGARIVFDHGSLPKPTAGLGVVATIARGSLSFDLGATAYQPRFAGGPRGGSGGAYVDLVTASARGCLRTTDEPVAVGACLGGELGREGTRGAGIEQPGTSGALWGALLVALEARAWPKGSVSPTAGVTIGHAFAAPDVVIQGFGPLFEPPVAFFRLHLGLDVRLF